MPPEYYNVSLYQEQGELDFIKEVWTAART